MDDPNTLFVVPHLRIQNANAISGNLTWGFPAMSAFIGVMQALERKAEKAGIDIGFEGVGVICHHHDAQVSGKGFTRTFNLTRNPVDKTGKTAAIVEEGRIHLDISLVFAVYGSDWEQNEAERASVAEQLTELLHSMRIAGGSIVPPIPGRPRPKPWMVRLPDDLEDQYKKFLSIRRRLMPGFALVLRDELLQDHYKTLLLQDPTVSRLDAWLDLSRLNMKSQTQEDGKVEWAVQRLPGWIVPIPVGYSALSEPYDPGTVVNSRDTTTPFRFVESLYSIGQWVSPHRLKHPKDLLWYVDNDLEQGLYRLRNDNHLQNHREEQEI